MKPYVLIFTAFAILQSCERDSSVVSSPDGTLKVTVYVDAGVVKYEIRKDTALVLGKSKLGLTLDNADLSKNLTLVTISPNETVIDSFKMLHGKRAACSYHANRRIYSFRSADSLAMDIIFQVSNDGVTFRYGLNGKSAVKRTALSEQTTFCMPSLATTAFLQPMSDAKTGWARVNPCYEEFYKKEIKAGTPSPTKAGWVFPALFRSGENWMHLTEAGLSATYCGTRLHQFSPEGEYKIDFPDSLEQLSGGSVRPQFTLPWKSPWRVVTIGSLKTLVESDLGVAVAEPQKLTDTDFVKPGHASWSWALLKDNSVVFSTQREFIDYAAEMHWDYCLLDVNWDTKIGYSKIKELSNYAASKGVGLFLWYNSSGDWNDTPYTPKSKLLSESQRAHEFSLLRDMGIKGVKIDFFGGDGQAMIQYYLGILEDAANYKLLVNFHGSTIPRGLHRTYPHLLSMEAVKGFEYVTFGQGDADEQPSHSAVIPFTRNLFDPVDFTPLSLDTIPRINRRTTMAFELALSIALYSGVQHFVETPQGMAKMPSFVKEFLADIPTRWEDVKFITGYPGKDFVVARRGGNRWYLAGINGENQEKIFRMDLSFMKNSKAVIIKDKKGEKKGLIKESMEVSAGTEVTVAPHGGFVAIGENQE